MFLICSPGWFPMQFALMSTSLLTLDISSRESDIWPEPLLPPLHFFCFNVHSFQWPLHGNVVCILLISFFICFSDKGSCSTTAFMFCCCQKYLEASWSKLVLIKLSCSHCKCFSFQHPLFGSLFHRLSICCTFCFLPACQKSLLMVRKHENYLKTVKRKLETSVPLGQTKAKLSCCTPLDRVMFNVCALLKIWWTVWNVARRMSEA